MTASTPLYKSKRLQELENVRGEIVSIPFKEQWEDKQVRFFAYIYKPHKDIGVDVEIRVYHYIIQSAYTEQEEEAWYKNEKLWTTIDIISLGITLIPIGGLAASAGIKAGAEGTKVIVRWAGKKLTKRNLRMRNTQNKTTIQQYEYKIIRHITRSTNRAAKPKYPKQSIHTMPQNVRARYEERVKNNWKRINDKFNGLKRRRAGGKWKNEVAQLPTKDKQGNPLEYIENDVNIILGGKRDAERIVIGRNKNTKQFNYDYIYYDGTFNNMGSINVCF